MRGHHAALLSALVERWRPEAHTFHLPVGEVTVTLEDVSYILGLPINGEAVTGRSDSSHQFLVENCIACFGREPGPQNHMLGKVNLAWVRRCRDTQESVERYVRAHIFCVLGTVVFPDKSTTSLNSKFLPLLRDFHRISEYSWGAVSLAHLYRSLCRASRYNCKEMDGPPILLFVWAWERMPLLAPIPRDKLGDVGIPLARRWSHWRRHTRYIRRPTAHFRRGLDDMGVDDVIYMAAVYGSVGSRCPRCSVGYVLHAVDASVLRVHRMAPDRPNSIPTLNSPSSAATLPSPTTCAPPSVKQGTLTSSPTIPIPDCCSNSTTALSPAYEIGFVDKYRTSAACLHRQ
ncbi:uncharacterized protein DS421_2g57100 [Arachis hypogaea]|nr:uncharacterized protein DS421_2g57100 [Arachis hypogaea]